MADGAAGRRRRGFIIAAAAVVIAVPAFGYSWLSERNAQRSAEDLAQDVAEAAHDIADIPELAAAELAAAWEDRRHSPLTAALGHHDEFSGAAFGSDAMSVVYSVQWGLATRCVHVLVERAWVTTDITNSPDCTPRAPPP